MVCCRIDIVSLKPKAFVVGFNICLKCKTKLFVAFSNRICQSRDIDFCFGCPGGHHYQIFRMAQVFLGMVKTRVEPVPHQEILEVTAIIHAGAKSREEKGRLVELAEVMG